MDAFFASVELLRYPELRGQTVVVGGRSIHQPVVQPDGSRRFVRLHEYAGRGVVTTSIYEPRARGICSGMGLMKSAALAPDEILLPANFDAYRDYSRKFKAAVAITEANDIRRAAGVCLKRVPLTKRMRLLGVWAAALSRRSDDLKASGMQPELVF